MDAILVIDGYNRLLCIDVYLPDSGTTSSMTPIEISASTLLISALDRTVVDSVIRHLTLCFFM